VARDRKPDAEHPDERENRRQLPRVAPWKKALVAASVLISLTGLGLWAYASATGTETAPPPPQRAIAPDGLAPSGLAPTEPRPVSGPGEAQPEPSQLEVWSPAIFRLGFGFFAGFCMAYALRAFMKITIIVIGVALLGLFGLQYAGLINVDWGAMESVYNTAAAWIRDQMGSFSEFVSGYLPSAASGVAGFAAGFTTRR
jgi:uncharacterized membrane protein (Fun14 family)